MPNPAELASPSPPPPPSPLFPTRQESNRTQPTGLVPSDDPQVRFAGHPRQHQQEFIYSPLLLLQPFAASSSKKRRLCRKGCYCWFGSGWELGGGGGGCGFLGGSKESWDGWQCEIGGESDEANRVKISSETQELVAEWY
uniref:Uncharacterized protein n=1 Tax=Oryza punctata TaxID=4537 RepID=A0A0E0KJS6_ORYPU